MISGKLPTRFNYYCCTESGTIKANFLKLIAFNIDICT